jgi:hypothetical protein
MKLNSVHVSPLRQRADEFFTTRSDGWKRVMVLECVGGGDASGVTIRVCCHSNEVDTNTLNVHPEKSERQDNYVQ